MFQTPSIPGAGTTAAESAGRIERGAEGPVLAPGQVAEVRVAERNGEAGVAVQGKFVPATLPQDSRVGERLLVRVEGQADAVVLRIISRGESISLQAAPTALHAAAETIRRLLPPEQQELLRVSLLPEQTPLAEEAPSEKKADEGQSEDQERDALLEKIREAFERLYRQKLLATAEALKDPAALAEVLARLHGPGLSSMLAEAKSLIAAIDHAHAESGARRPVTHAMPDGLRAACGIIERQSFLDQLSPLLKRVGEQPLSLVPVAGEKKVSRAEYLIEPAKFDRPGELHLYLPLEGMGAARVRVFSDETQTYVIITVRNHIQADFLRARIDELTAAIVNPNRALQVTIGESDEIRPLSVEWEHRFVTLDREA